MNDKLAILICITVLYMGCMMVIGVYVLTEKKRNDEDKHWKNYVFLEGFQDHE